VAPVVPVYLLVLPALLLRMQVVAVVQVAAVQHLHFLLEQAELVAAGLEDMPLMVLLELLIQAAAAVLEVKVHLLAEPEVLEYVLLLIQTPTIVFLHFLLV